ncbi:MAG: asparagine synthase-related protein [Pirellulales bacterium]|nr:asparagine synthase-related protein [Pirellulales bacterium]
MGAIYGFTGPPEATLRRTMGESLAHRGSSFACYDEQRRGTVAYQSHHTPPSSDPIAAGSLDVGLFSDGQQVVALAGFLTCGQTKAGLAGLLQRYRQEGLAFVRELQGDFVLAVLDGPQLHLVRDGSGARTIYYGRHAGRFLFGVEPKALWQSPGFDKRLRAAALAQYLTFSFVPGEGTMLENIFELPAGHAVTLDPGKDPKMWRYFVFEDDQHEEDGRNHPDQWWVDRFRQTFARSVAERMPANESPVVFLSGGLDSSVVTAEVARQSTKPVRTFALHFGEKYPHELEYAAAVAARCGTQHEEILIRPDDFLPRLRQMIWHLDDPIGDPITMPNFELAQRTAQYSNRVFNGEGGDPCFGGPKNIPMLLSHWYGGVERDDRFRERAYLASYRRGYEEISRLLAPEWRAQIDERRDLDQVIRPFFEASRPERFLDKLSSINIRLKGAHLILPKVERMLGAARIVPLSPLFSEAMIRLSFQMPSRLKLAGGVEKVVLKRAYEDQLPPEVIARPKSGMRVPVHFWFRGEMKRYARKILNPRHVRRAGMFDPERVKQLLNYDTQEGPGRYGIRLWMLITLEMWRRIVIEGESP